jgi:hypothetical protein
MFTSDTEPGEISNSNTHVLFVQRDSSLSCHKRHAGQLSPSPCNRLDGNAGDLSRRKLLSLLAPAGSSQHNEQVFIGRCVQFCTVLGRSD